jgi:hypothetical protein
VQQHQIKLILPSLHVIQSNSQNHPPFSLYHSFTDGLAYDEMDDLDGNYDEVSYSYDVEKLRVIPYEAFR